MKRMFCLALAAVVSAGSCAQLTPEQRVVNDAADALGGRNRLLAVKTLVIEGEGSNGNLGQDMTPDATGQTFTITAYRRTIDMGGGRSRIEQTRTPNFAYFQGQAPQKQVQGLDGDVGYNVAPSGTATRVAATVTRDRRADLHHHPLTIVRAALDPAATLANARTAEGQRSVDITIANGQTFTLAVDETSGLPTRTVSMTSHPNLGDVAIETAFDDYQDVNGLKLPARLTTRIDRFTTAEIRVTKQTVAGDAGDLAAPQAAAAAAVVTGPPPATVTVEQVANGIWLLAGQSHHSVLAEFSDHLTLIEAPQHETRTLAVIRKARELRPDKPLTQVVSTHHHFDHSGGIRAAVSEGLAVVAHRSTAGFYQHLVERSHTIAPDALAKKPAALRFEPVDAELTLQDGSMALTAYHIAGNPHADTLLMVYFPRARLLVEADVYSPGAAVQPYASNLVDNINRRQLRVDRIVPIHGTIVPFTELVKSLRMTN
jgi:glyoxylase-like metal-dependent hydrolase (beta-lactamase superfamily II)